MKKISLSSYGDKQVTNKFICLDSKYLLADIGAGNVYIGGGIG